MEHPDLLEITETQQEMIEADGADLFVSISGTAYFSRQAALTKAHEVAGLVVALKKFGLAENQIRLQDVSVETITGTFSKSSSATYSLKIENVSPSQVAEVTSIIAAQPNVSLDSTDWLFSQTETRRAVLVEQCARRAKERAQALAQVLGVQLLSVYELYDPESRRGGACYSIQRSRSQASAMIEEWDLDVSHAQALEVKLNVKFRISAFDGS